MKVAEYKGYTIEFHENTGEFSITTVNGSYATYAAVKTKIDKVVKAEVKGNFPIDVVTSGFKKGTITSYNAEEKKAWVSVVSEGRQKNSLTDYAGNPRFYKASEVNLKLADEYKTLSDQITELNKRQRNLTTQLTEPITFEP